MAVMTESTRFPYEPSVQLRDVDALMGNFAHHAVHIFENDPARDVLIPLNGSVLPLFYVMQQYASDCPQQLPEFIKRLVFVVDSKNGDRKVEDFRTSSVIQTPDIFYLDDIVDEGHSAAAFLSKVSGHIDVIAPIQKEHTEKNRRMYNPTRLGTQTIKAVPNEWYAGGLGMNEGMKLDNPEAQALLSTLQRFSRSVFFVNNDALTDEASRTDFFSKKLLPAFSVDDPLFRLCYRMECAKIMGDTQGFLDLSQQVVPVIMQKLGFTT